MLADAGGIGAGLAQSLEARGGQVVVVRAETIDPADVSQVTRRFRDALSALGGPATGVIHLWSVDADRADDEAAGAFESAGRLLHVVQALAAAEAVPPPRLTVVTRGAVSVDAAARDVSPAQASAWGLARTVENEHPELGCTSIDINPLDGADVQPHPRGLDLLAGEILQPGPEHQVAFRSGRRYVARLVEAQRVPSTPGAQSDADAAMALEVGTTGLLDTLDMRPAVRRSPGPGEIEVRVAAAGLNFRDVLCALGMYPGPAGPLGSECVGTVVAAGPGVTHVRPGDEVLGMADGGLRTYVTGPAATFTVRPPDLTVNDAATVPVTFLTAEYALNRLARMQRGRSRSDPRGHGRRRTGRRAGRAERRRRDLRHGRQS